MHLTETEWGGVDWLLLAHIEDHWQALMNMVVNLWVP